MYWIDTHCHLFASEFDEDRSTMINRALNNNVMQMMLPNIDMDTLPLMMSLAKSFPECCKPMIGLHPCSVKEDFGDVLTKMKIEIQKGGFYGIGETGVDLYWETKTKDIQIAAFEAQIEWGREFDFPVIIHSRESLDLTIDIISRHQDGTLKGIFHCFGGTYSQAMLIHELGFKIGVGGVITFKKSELGQLLPKLPKEIIVLETDSPYLAPVPHRGKRNESSYLVLVAEKVAQSLNLSLEEVAKLTTSNAHDVFGKKG